MGRDFLSDTNQASGGLPIAVFGVNVGLGLRLCADEHPAGPNAAVIVYMGFLRGKTAHQNVFFGIAAVTVGVAFVFREGAGQYLLRSIAGFPVGVQKDGLPFFIAADVTRFLGEAQFAVNMGMDAFPLFKAALERGFFGKAAFDVGVGAYFPQGTDQVSAAVITERIMVVNHKIGITADSISLAVKAKAAVTVDFQGTAQVSPRLLTADQYTGTPAGIRMGMFFFPAERFRCLGVADEPQLPDSAQGSGQGKSTAQSFESPTPCLTAFVIL